MKSSREWWCHHWCGSTAISSQLSRANLLFAKPTPDLVLKIKNIHCARSLPPRLVCGSVNFDYAAGFLHVWCGGACIRWQGRRQRLAHGASTCRSHGTSTCTSCASLLRAPWLALCTTNLASIGRMILVLLPMSFIPWILTYLSRAHNQRELFSGDRRAFQNASARTCSDAHATHMRKASGIMQMRQKRQMQFDEDACIRNWTDKLTKREYHSLYTATRCFEIKQHFPKTLWDFVVLERWCA